MTKEKVSDIISPRTKSNRRGAVAVLIWQMKIKNTFWREHRVILKLPHFWLLGDTHFLAREVECKMSISFLRSASVSWAETLSVGNVRSNSARRHASYLPDVQVQDEEGSVIVGWAKWEEHHSETGEHLPDSAKPDKQNWAEKETIFF